MGLLRTLLWLVLFVVCTFCWFVLFEHSFQFRTFVTDAKDEYRNLMEMIQGKSTTSSEPGETPAGH